MGSYDSTETTSTSPTSFGSTIIHANNNSPCADLVIAGQMPSGQCTPSTPAATVAAPAEKFTGANGETNCGGAPGTVSGAQVPGTIALLGPSAPSIATTTVTDT